MISSSRARKTLYQPLYQYNAWYNTMPGTIQCLVQYNAWYKEFSSWPACRLDTWAAAVVSRARVKKHCQAAPPRCQAAPRVLLPNGITAASFITNCYDMPVRIFGYPDIRGKLDLSSQGNHSPTKGTAMRTINAPAIQAGMTINYGDETAQVIRVENDNSGFGFDLIMSNGESWFIFKGMTVELISVEPYATVSATSLVCSCGQQHALMTGQAAANCKCGFTYPIPDLGYNQTTAPSPRKHGK